MKSLLSRTARNTSYETLVTFWYTFITLQVLGSVTIGHANSKAARYTYTHRSTAIRNSKQYYEYGDIFVFSVVINRILKSTEYKQLSRYITKKLTRLFTLIFILGIFLEEQTTILCLYIKKFCTIKTCTCLNKLTIPSIQTGTK